MQAHGSMYRFLECTVDRYMTTEVKTVMRGASLRELATLFEAYDFNAFPVAEEGRMLGIVTKFDFLRAFVFTKGQMVPHYDEIMRRRVMDVMTTTTVHVDPAAPLTRVLQMMVDLKARSFPVLDAEGRLVGIISREDIMGALRQATTEPGA
jgi:CBS domain-containing protein